MTSLAHNTTNDTRFDDLMSNVRELGRDSASGKDALPKLAMRVVQAAADGVIDTAKDKHGDGVDDAKYIYTKYAESESKKSVHDHTDAGIKSNVSKVRKLIEFGASGTSKYDPVAVLERAHKMRTELQTTGEKVKGAYPSYVDVARAQLDLDATISDDELKSAIRVKDPADKTVEKVLESVKKTLEKLITGDAGVKDQSEEVIKAHELIGSRLAALMVVKERTDDEAKLAELTAKLGVSVLIPAQTEVPEAA